MRPLWLDADAFVTRDPFDLLPPGVDFVGVDDWWDDGVAEVDSPSVCSCFIALGSGGEARMLLQRWASVCRTAAGDGFHEDQPPLNAALHEFSEVRGLGGGEVGGRGVVRGGGGGGEGLGAGA